MTIKNILLYLGLGDGLEKKTSLALNLAQTHNASLTALYVVAPPENTRRASDTGAFTDDAETERDRADKAEADFREAAAAADVEVEWHRTGSRDIESLKNLYATTDLIIMGQRHEEGPDPDLPEDVVMGSGRPVLMIPHSGDFTEVGKTVMVAWDESREATRATFDAMPLLERADKVVVYSVNAPDATERPGACICEALRHHNANVEHHRTVAHDIDVGAVLLSASYDLDADLIVMGAYGHSRFREHLLGGATRDVFLQMTRPVLFSH